MEVRHLGVVGAGQMGSGIAQVAAGAGLLITLVDLTPADVERGLERIQGSLQKFVQKGKISQEEVEQTMTRISSNTDLRALSTADCIIEAVVEDAEVKGELFTRLDKLGQPAAILASNTSSISITRLAACTQRPEQVLGLHFMNPVPLMQLVEVIRGHLTSEATFALGSGLATTLGKTPVEVQDYPGFISNRLLLPMLNEAMQCVMEGVATPEAIDQIMTLGMNHPMGPLALADLIGLDTCLSIMEVLHQDLGDDKYRPSPLLRRMVQAGYLGRKSGQGFYHHRQ